MRKKENEGVSAVYEAENLQGVGRKYLKTFGRSYM